MHSEDRDKARVSEVALKKILIIDDDEMNREVLEAFLSSESYQIFLAHNGSSGLRSALEVHPDLIILDVKMPDMSGYEVSEQLRQYPETKHTPIMIVTGFDDPEDRERGMQAGANAFLARPFNGEELITSVARLITG